MALAVAGVTALAILLIAFGVATSGGSGISDRLERYAAKPKDRSKSAATGQSGVAELIATSQALNSLNRVVEGRDFGANLARDIARADLHLKPSEFLLIWGSSIVGVPLVMLLMSALLPALGNPLFLLVGFFVGFMAPRFWLARRRNGRLGAFNKQLPDTITLIANALRAGSSFLQAIELVVRESRPPN
jgi:tight adherence protein B